ncbi:hypothetical protein ACFL2U_00835 [Patescibacteria group bacterium]
MRKMRIRTIMGVTRDVEDTPDIWEFIGRGLAEFVEYVWYIDESRTATAAVRS